MIDPEEIRRIIADFEEETGAVIAWRFTCSPFMSGAAALGVLSKYLADRLNADAAAEIEALRKENAELTALFSDRVQDCELARVAVQREREACARACDAIQAEADQRYAGSADPSAGSDGAIRAAEAIRARGEP